MGVQELRAETQRRGLGTARSRADLIQRLTDHDAATPANDDFDELDTVAPEADPVQHASAPSAPGPTPGVFRKTFQAEAGGPDEETHLAYREATRQAAVEAGHTPRGDARLVAAVDGRWVYELFVRQVT